MMQIQFDKSIPLYDIARAAGYIGCTLVNNGSGEIVIVPRKPKESIDKSCEKISWSTDD